MKKLEKYADSQFRKLRKHLKQSTDSSDLEILHKIRVDIKRIKAVLRVLQEQFPDFDSHKAYLPLRDIFRSAGSIREKDVSRKMAERLHVQGHDDDQSESEPTMEDFGNRAPEFLASLKAIRNELEPLLNATKTATLQLYLTSQKLFVKSGLYPFPAMEDIHKIRKAIKEIIYLSDLVEGKDQREIKFFKKLEKSIGQFHDNQVLLSEVLSEEQRKRINKECLKGRNSIFRLASSYYS